mmetsp:Transcript_12063/g.18509  ORF Transcript_12063/g.18509 Transcript_12063/m.18509 type:complete len:496 (+) Transcript_12063:97-1584(+)|eukprot:CAMPEP_0178922570 /NCGR_PEP_ID=MMETSP0786-20121207/16233_1 /TAXON_ID=186022 /ORGANISM="Thalassionema frauenfeldii, Strain CCMP 1798" /LENGTH=495 /DNA_ID=CAMNT_0020596961 /DNA_START=51 /DNA_END=1538 /DNA_ORIENTATION=-
MTPKPQQYHNDNDSYLEELRDDEEANQDATTPLTEKASNNNRCWLWNYIFIPSILFKGLQRSTIPVIPEFVHTVLHGSHADIGMVVAFVGLGRWMGNLPCGMLVNYSGSYFGLIGSCLWTSLAWYLASSSHRVVGLAATCLMEGIGLSLWQLSRQTLVTQTFSSERRGGIQAWTGGLERLSSVVGPALGGTVAHACGLRAPFGLKASLMLLAGLVYIVLLRRSGNPKNRTTRSKQFNNDENKRYGAIPTASTSWSSLSALPNDTNDDNDAIKVESSRKNDKSSSNYCTILQKNLRMLALVSVFVVGMPLARETRLILFPLKAMALGFSPQVIGGMMALTFVVDASLFPVAGWCMDRYGRKYAGVPSSLCLAISYALPPLLLHTHNSSSQSHQLIILTVISCISGIGNGLSCGVMNVIGSDLATIAQQEGEQNTSALFLALYRTIADTGIFLGPFVGGFLSEWRSLDQAFGIISAISLIASLWLAFVMPETAKHID